MVRRFGEEIRAIEGQELRLWCWALSPGSVILGKMLSIFSSVKEENTMFDAQVVNTGISQRR